MCIRDRLDTTKWQHEVGTGTSNGLYGWGNSELQYYQPLNTVISNGTAKIIALEEPNGITDPWNNTYFYSSSRITTKGKHDFKYGKVQARIKTVDGEGFWPAFWMLPSGGSWPCDGEIDIMEQWGNDGATSSTTGAAHVGLCPYSSGSHMYNSFQHDISPNSFADNFHVYEIRWDVGYIGWYVDNVLIHQITPSVFPPQYSWPFDSNNWYIILNLPITSSGPNSGTTFPSQIEVDWVRVYENNGLVDGCTDFNAQNYNANATFDNGTCEYLVEFELNTNCSNFSSIPTNIQLTGPNVGWSCQSGFNLTDIDGDGIWNGSFVLPEGNFEYKYCGDNWSYNEDLLYYAQSTGDWSCIGVTDYWNYANRQINIQSNLVINDTWESCEDCIGGCTDSIASNYDENANYNNNSCVYDLSLIHI